MVHYSGYLFHYTYYNKIFCKKNNSSNLVICIVVSLLGIVKLRVLLDCSVVVSNKRLIRYINLCPRDIALFERHLRDVITV